MKEALVDDMEARPSLLEPIKDEPEELTEWEQKSGCEKCCHYLFCCCCCVKYEKSKALYTKGWRKYLEKEGNDSSDRSFQILTNFFVNADSIEGLENIRLNPNLVSQNKLRNDLEFYIPQLCTFLLFGEVKVIDAFFVFLCKVCNASFFFAHRVHWFLSAMINNAQDNKENIINFLKIFNTLFKSENKQKSNKLENFYISNSDAYINYIKKKNLLYLYDTKNIEGNVNIFDKIDFNSLDTTQQLFYNKFKENREIIIDFSDNEYKMVKEKQIQKLRDSGKLKNMNSNLITNNEIKDENNIIKTDKDKKEKQFKPNDFLIDISNFKLNNTELLFEEDDLFDINENEKVGKFTTQQQNYLYNKSSNENDFINIEKSLDINYISYRSTLNFIDHLCDISNELPKHPIDEQMLFLYEQLNIINKRLPCNVYLPFLKDSIRNYLICHIPLDGVKIFRTKTRCPIMLTFEVIRIDEINQEIIKNERQEEELKLEKNKHRNSSVNYSLNLIPNKDDGEELLEDIITDDSDYRNTDYDLSKPLLINQENNKKTKKNRKNTKSKDDMNAYNKNEKFLKIARIFQNMNSSRNLIQSKTVFEKKPLNPEEVFSKAEKKKKKKNKKNDILIEKINNINPIDIQQNEIIQEEEIKPINQSLKYEDFSNIFGETFVEKENNLKKTSLFGKFKSHKIFRCIFKTHEDLRQEQFATQLINEFNQIFKLEGVNCWLNTYEIISTGNDSGLVEMVNDSLSLDQLKQKLNNISLHDFYLYYWGKGHSNSPEYKKAMKNYVSSLAGYSLICYFLQIKDRHNGNILIDNEGHLTHIDFGFLLSNAPGKGLKFENAPFKLSHDMVECLGGTHGEYFDNFRKLLKKGFLAVYKHRQKIIILVEMMWCGNGRNLECFEKGQEAIDELKSRLKPKGCTYKRDIFKFVDGLIEQSVDNWRTKWYDIFQYYVQGIFY